MSKREIETINRIIKKKSLINVSNESMLGKVFGYFFSE